MYKTFLHSKQIYYGRARDEQDMGPPLWELAVNGGEEITVLHVLHAQLCAWHCASQGTFTIKNNCNKGFPSGTVVKNPPANAGDTGSSPGPGRSHMPQRS